MILIASPPTSCTFLRVMFRGGGFLKPLRLLQVSRQRARYHELTFAETNASILEVLAYNQSDDEDLLASPPTMPLAGSKSWVRVDVHAAPWNPADTNTVQGTYASPYDPDDARRGRVEQLRQGLLSSGAPAVATVAGSEGIGRISEVVSSDSSPAVTATDDLKVGDWVTFALPGLGTMRSSLWLPSGMLLQIDRGNELMTDDVMGPFRASTLFQLGGTALRLLSDFGPSNMDTPPVILQNAGNSGVGFMINQLAGILYPGSSVVSFVRRSNRSERAFEALCQHLTASSDNQLAVVSEEDLLRDREAFQELKAKLLNLNGGSLPILALNAVGGDSSTLLLKFLGPSGTKVTYGGLSRKPVTVTTSQLIFKDVSIRGYWHSRWMIQHGMRERQEMANQLVSLVLDHGMKCPPVEVFPLSRFTEGIEFDESQSASSIRKKVVFDCLDDARTKQ